MSEQTKTDDKSSQVPSGIALVAILLSLFAIQDTVFQPTRPPMMNSERAFSEDVRSRLWQDPFEVVEEHRKQHPVQQAVSGRSEFPEEISYKNDKNQSARIIFKNAKDNDNGRNVLIQPAASDDKHAYEYGKEPVTVCFDKDKEKTAFL